MTKVPDPHDANMKLINEAESERDFLAKVVQLFTLQGWLVYHVLETYHPAKRIGPGFPDLVLLQEYPNRVRLIFAELKSEKGDCSPEQAKWLLALNRLPSTYVEVYVWRPSNWEEIIKIAQGGRA